MATKRIKEQDELKFEIGGVCFSLRTKQQGIKEQIMLYYKDYTSRREPDIRLNIKYKGFFKKPNLKSLLFQTRTWKLGREHGRLFLYYRRRNKSSLIKFNAGLNNIKCYIQGFSDKLLLYILPEILLSLILPKYQALMLHACGVLTNKKGYLFVAKSGGGKSTIAKLALKQGLTLLSDDRIIIRKEKKLFKIYGNPWHGEIQETSNSSSNIEEIFFLKKSEFNQIKLISKVETVAELYKNSFYFPINNDIINMKLNFCAEVVKQLDCYQFAFKPDRSIWRHLDEFFK